jgi:hypothetical protein
MRFWSLRRSVLIGISAGLAGVLATIILADSLWDAPGRLIGVAVVVPATIGAYLSARKPILEITPSEIRFREDSQFRFRILRFADVDSIEWPGHDNIGLRLKSGRVVAISVMALPEKDRGDALAEIRRAVTSAAQQGAAAAERH